MSVRTMSDEVVGEVAVSTVAEAVVEVLARRPGEVWYLADLAVETGNRLADVAMCVARLTVGGVIAHDGIGSGYWLEPDDAPTR